MQARRHWALNIILCWTTQISLGKQTPNTHQNHSVGGKGCRKPKDIKPQVYFLWMFFSSSESICRIPPTYVNIYITLWYVYIYILYTHNWCVYIVIPPSPKRSKRIACFFFSVSQEARAEHEGQTAHRPGPAASASAGEPRVERLALRRAPRRAPWHWGWAGSPEIRGGQQAENMWKFPWR